MLLKQVNNLVVITLAGFLLTQCQFKLNVSKNGLTGWQGSIDTTIAPIVKVNKTTVMPDGETHKQSVFAAAPVTSYNNVTATGTASESDNKPIEQ